MACPPALGGSPSFGRHRTGPAGPAGFTGLTGLVHSKVLTTFEFPLIRPPFTTAKAMLFRSLIVTYLTKLQRPTLDGCTLLLHRFPT